MLENNTFALIFQSSLVVKFVLLILFSFSIFSWAIIVYKFKFFLRLERECKRFVALFKRWKNQPELYQVLQGFTVNPMVNLFETASASQSWDDKRRELARVVNHETANFERYLNFLATTGSTAPFIGLFGTVWGIMDSFRGIGKAGSASLATVAPGIAEALIATAVGLAAAIPAVMAYNYFLGKVKKNVDDMEDFAQELLDLRLSKDAVSTEKTGAL
jgi:biopolymer transport protein TolQ